MPTYDFNVPTKEVDGREVERTLREILLEFIGTETKGNTVKLCYWYGVLMGKNALELDDIDKKEFVDLVTNTDRLMVFLKAQLLEILNHE